MLKEWTLQTALIVLEFIYEGSSKIFGVMQLVLHKKVKPYRFLKFQLISERNERS